jgi:hypothetical protein
MSKIYGDDSPQRPQDEKQFQTKPEGWSERRWDYYKQLIEDAGYTHEQAVANSASQQ